METERFAKEVRVSFPAKPLVFCFSPTLHELRWCDVDHEDVQKKLRKLADDYYFVAESGFMTFFSFPRAIRWILFDDRCHSDIDLVEDWPPLL